MDQDWDETVYRRVSPRLMGLAASLVGPTDAHDVVAGALERVMSSTSRSDVRNIEAYLVRAVVNEARSWSRSAGRRRARETRWASSLVDPPREPHIGDPELVEALLGLPVRQRAVVFLTYWADLAPDGVARLLGVSSGSVRKHLARARAALREELS